MAPAAWWSPFEDLDTLKSMKRHECVTLAAIRKLLAQSIADNDSWKLPGTKGKLPLSQSTEKLARGIGRHSMMQ